jgi:ABC-type multidrug transport system permease subunit
MSFLIFFFFFSLCGAATETVLLSFDKSSSETTSSKWTLTNDPVMGGLSSSNWTVDDVNQKGIWDGVVRIVPSLSAPVRSFFMNQIDRLI